MKIGEIINTIDVRNSSLEDLQLLGLSMEKKFINSVANTIGTDMSKYKILCKNQFATNFIHVGRDGKVPIALYQGEKALVSSAYETFEVKDTSKILPEYLFLWFKRSEFDREATFYASAGIRGGFDWEDFINMEIPVPPIEEQRRIVAEYQTVERRIKNNETLIQKLEETAQAIYHHTFIEGIDENNLPEGWRMGCLGDVACICSGKDHKELDNGDIPIYGSGGLMRMGNNYLYKGESVLIPRKGTLNNIMYVNEAFWTVDTLFYTTMKIKEIALYLYYSIKDINFLAQDSGTSVPSNTSKELNMVKLLIPSNDVLCSFNKQCQSIIRSINCFKLELTHLRKLQSLLTSKLA